MPGTDSTATANSRQRIFLPFFLVKVTTTTGKKGLAPLSAAFVSEIWQRFTALSASVQIEGHLEKKKKENGYHCSVVTSITSITITVVWLCVCVLICH